MPDPDLIKRILQKKKDRQKITMLTAYDYPSASFLEEAGVDIILVGDSVANVVLGLESTLEVGMPEMLHHAKAVRRGAKKALVVGDMPFSSYQEDPGQALQNAKRFIDEAGCDAVKLEWFDECLEVTKAIRQEGIPVMGHVGLTPQTAEKLGGFKVQGKDSAQALKIIQDALDWEEKGCFSLVLECIPSALADIITQRLTIPTIGIGAGPVCDGQVLVLHDILGLFKRFQPKFVKPYADIYASCLSAVRQFKDEVEKGIFPGKEQSFSIGDEDLKNIMRQLDGERGNEV